MNATVTLPISELDTLRDTIKGQTEKISAMQENERTLVVKLIESNVISDYSHMMNNPYGKARQKTVFVESYKNLDDVVEPLKEKLREEVHAEVASIEANKEYIRKELKITKEENLILKKNLAKKKENEEVVSLQTKYKEILDKFEALEKDNQNLNKTIAKNDELFSKLEKYIVKLRNRSFWQRLFNVIS